jgi:FkbM family methyltransferase
MGAHGPVQQGAGHIVTRMMMWKPVRRTALGRRMYGRMYLCGKAFAERSETRFFREHVRPGMTIVDMGAHVGFYTVQFSRLVGETGAVHAFEPDPFCASVLRDRLRRLASARNVHVEEAAVGETECARTLYCSNRDRATNRTYPLDPHTPAETVQVSMLSLDAYCRAHGIDRIDAVKIDVEGAEVSVLRGMRETMSRHPPAWMFIEFCPKQLVGAGETPEAFWQALAADGYESYATEGSERGRRILDTAAFTREHGHSYTNVWAVHRSQPAFG